MATSNGGKGVIGLRSRFLLSRVLVARLRPLLRVRFVVGGRLAFARFQGLFPRI
jgi:hypothetical protein